MKADSKVRKPTISPYIPVGAISIDKLSKMIESLKNEGARNVRLGGEITFIWNDSSLPERIPEKLGIQTNSFKESSVRPVKLCSAEIFCNNYKRPVLNLAVKIDKVFLHTKLSAKLHIGIAGCIRSCSEPVTKDIGIIAHSKGFELYVGGAAGFKPMLAKRIGIIETEDEVISAVSAIIDYHKDYAKKSERLGILIERKGLKNLLEKLAVCIKPMAS